MGGRGCLLGLMGDLILLFVREMICEVDWILIGDKIRAKCGWVE